VKIHEYVMQRRHNQRVGTPSQDAVQLLSYGVLPMTVRRPSPPDVTGKLSIGALSRSTGIPIDTLRTWERRYGFPVPERKPSGHRVYPLSSVPRLQRIADALTRGHRASEAVAASEQALTALLNVTPVTVNAVVRIGRSHGEPLTDLLAIVKTFNTKALRRALMTDWRRLGPVPFLSTCIAPLIRAVGEEWAAGRLGIHHEHFLSERVGDFLRTVRQPLEERATGPLVIVASLPGEEHGLGLQMAALVLAHAGCRILYLGPEVPPQEIASLAKDLTARAVAVSISVANRGDPMTAQLALLRSLLPKSVLLLVGGDGAPRPQPGITVLHDLAALDDWGRQLIVTR
jgi:MerR family transcriptional regulator, light-induced transcriptional regulator